MHMNRREFLQLLAVAAASGMALDSKSALAGKAPANFYDVPRHGNVSFLHFTDCHAQLLPVWFRRAQCQPWHRRLPQQDPHLVGSIC
jgi:sulfur-oxidizing protein SoxB